MIWFILFSLVKSQNPVVETVFVQCVDFLYSLYVMLSKRVRDSPKALAWLQELDPLDECIPI